MTLVRAQWYPAAVVLPDQPQPWRKVMVILADNGIHIFRTPAETADWYAPIDWEQTTIPPGRQARNGVDVHLPDGRLVVVTSGAGCRCGALGRWSGPNWAATEAIRR